MKDATAIKYGCFVVTTLLLLVVTGCRDFGLESEEDNPTGPVVVEATQDQPFLLGLGNTATLDDADVEIEFSLMGNDSRCPADVDCIHPGQATIILTIKDSQNVRVQIALSIPGLTFNPSELQAVTFQGLRYQLLALYPYPTSEGIIRPEQRRALIRIDRVFEGEAAE